MWRDKGIVELREQVRKLTKELQQLRGSPQRNPCRRGYDVNPIDIAYCSSQEDFDDDE